MPEAKQEVRTFEVDYECDACGKGMMAPSPNTDPTPEGIEHRCVICNHVQMFKRPYPRIDYVEAGE